jgi:hypothetical protein
VKYFKVTSRVDTIAYYAAGLSEAAARKEIEDVMGPLPPQHSRVVEVARSTIPEGTFVWGEGEIGDPEAE